MKNSHQIEKRRSGGRALILLQQCLELGELSPHEVAGILEEHGEQPQEIIQGVQKVRVDEAIGDLVMGSDRKTEEIRLCKPVIYRLGKMNITAEDSGAKHFVDGGYAIDSQGRVGFEIAKYDGARPLIIGKRSVTTS